jgi:predicted ATP-grasp superfamily ATP-dependent carboligase
MSAAMRQGDHLLIFGASARAAAFSALRAGLRPWCADLFADADLGARCPAMRLPGRYPGGFLDLVKSHVPGPWMYTGGLENHTLLIAQMEQHRPLWGNSPDALSSIRSPEVLAEAARAAGLPAPIIARRQPPGRGTWLVKPLAGSAGAGIRFWSEQKTVPDNAFLQQYIEGLPASVLYAGLSGRAILLGTSRQLVGESFLHAPAFRYCGSIGPLAVAPALREALGQLGNQLVGRTGVRGLFGVDGILSEGGFWPVEVNPRYTASVEVLEYATGLCAMEHHRAAFEGGVLPVPGEAKAGFVGKGLLYARNDGRFPTEGPWRKTLDSPLSIEEMPAFADLPHVGERLESGRPVLTLFCRCTTFEGCLLRLKEIVADAERWLYP